MARLQGRGSSCSPTRNRTLTSEAHPAPNPLALHAQPVLRTLAIILVTICVVATSAAQLPVDDVHIQPRIEPAKVKDPEPVDFSLKSHNQPIKVDVSLVLVPVTITDPLNRLVTGLDKDNFQVFEGKEQQELRHFSA
jgi:Ca-activated chloride channel family protein